MFKKWFLSIILVGFLVVSTACGNQATNLDSSEGNVLEVTVTIGQIADVVANVGGEHVKVNSLMGPGVDPHLYQASQGDISKLDKADIIFYNGLHLEGKMGEIFEKMREDKPTVAVAEAVPVDKLIAVESNEKAHDPHVWFDIDLWIYAIEEVRDALSELDSANADSYKANATAYIEKLKDLKTYSLDRVAEIPEESRILVTAHDAFGYFGRAYDFDVVGLQGLSTDAEYGLRDVQNLVNLLVDKNIKAVFIESSISENSIEAVVEGAKQKGHTVVIGGELFSDAMGEAGTVEGTYYGMYKHNIDTIVDSLK
ncbi:manganese transporter [Bacillus sp. HMF5848]|uniref:metal ABC transporter solute-binding protein, Zn/Mn family n=1 Tax=Bacillus sp. HMF5848 TaxID=2495421 RepID=UPI000F7A9BA9|nr:zinc ABC transporter substrate-binding protein [Bacillus sp. HMF5848]RSK28275.1 manganese transporter [Bacillus sp. HMF5848]